MKITMYELLGLVKDGKAPKRIRIRSAGGVYDKEFYFDGDIYMYKDEDEEYAMTDDISIEMLLNDEVEILEEENKKCTVETCCIGIEGLSKALLKIKDDMKSIYENIDKAETLEEEKKIPEKLPYYSMKKIQKAKNKDEWREERISLLEKRVENLHIKMNDLLDYLKSKGDE